MAMDPAAWHDGTMNDAVDIWLRLNGHPEANPLFGMREAGLCDPVADYASIARIKAAIVERTGLLGLASVWGGRHLVFRHFLGFGSAAQRASLAGKALAVAISEPQVGAHPKLLTTQAVPALQGWSISGQKAWVTNGADADAIIVFAITAEDTGRKRYSAFIVPRSTRGLAVQDMPGFHALRPSRHCLMTLSDVHVPADALLGEPDTAYERMALPFRDVEDAVGTFAILGAFGRAVSEMEAGAEERGALVALNAVYRAAAENVVADLDNGRLRTGDATLVGLRVLALEMLGRLICLGGKTPLLTDLEAVLNIARGPRLARQVKLGERA